MPRPSIHAIIFLLVVVTVALLSENCIAFTTSSKFQRTNCSALFSAANTKSSSSSSSSSSPNEFSRPIHTDVILSPRSSRRTHHTQITANENELQNLAERFSLSKISKLDADLTLTKDSSRSGSSSSTSRSSTNDGICIQVKGDVISQVTQRCVRTNEEFEVDLEFSILSIVRASNVREMKQTQELGGMSIAQIEGQLTGGGNRGGKNKKGKKKRGGNSYGNGGTLNDMNMKEIENMLQEFDLDDDTFEDENVLGPDGVIDVGELVAQMFRLKLDPYPKKPGSEPVSYTITG